MNSATNKPNQPPDPNLQKFIEKARRETENQVREIRARKKRGKKPKKLRIIVWSIQIALLLGIADCALHRRFGGEDRKPQVKSGPELPWPAEVIPVPPLGDNMQELTGLEEVSLAKFANTEKLADGSESMRQAQEEYARENGLPVEVKNSIGMRFRLVPPGSFIMGSPETEKGRGEIEKQHVKTVHRPFYLGKFEVTQQQYESVMGNNPSHFRGPQRPVEEVTWYNALQFCKKLSEREGLEPTAYRLPAEAEWEYACRAGTTSAYYFGDDPADLGKYAETAENNYDAPRPVGQRLPNALGLYNLHGNVWEWCLDRYVNYPDVTTPLGEYKDWRCLRGGNWYVAAPECRSANRCRLAGTSKGNVLGFRVLRSIK